MKNVMDIQNLSSTFNQKYKKLFYKNSIQFTLLRCTKNKIIFSINLTFFLFIFTFRSEQTIAGERIKKNMKTPNANILSSAYPVQYNHHLIK